MAVALIVAAGRGTRMGGPVPKQYRLLGGVAVIRHTILAFCDHAGIGGVQAVIHPADRALYAKAVAGLDLPEPVLGGATRQESVRQGLEAFAPTAPDKVLIHDAVRPFVATATITAVLAALDRHTAVLAGVPVSDTLKRCRDGVVEATIDRRDVWRAQTPQGFDFARILAAHRAAAAEAIELTDDAMVAERAGLAVAMVEGGEDAFKITTEADLARAEQVLRLRLPG